MAQVDVEAVLTKLAAEQKEKLDWRQSIVDLMKLLKLDSSLTARKQLAQELGYTGDTNDSASMNIWLHSQVTQKLAENGGKVPDSLKAA
jgi:HEAT repeat protein